MPTDRELDQKLSSPEILSAMLNRALEGLRRLDKNNKFSLSSGMVAAHDEYRESNDHCISFIKNCLRSSPKKKMTKDRMYTYFRDWCQSNGLNAPSSRDFVRRMTEAGIKEGFCHSLGKTSRCWINVDFVNIDSEFDDKRESKEPPPVWKEVPPLPPMKIPLLPEFDRLLDEMEAEETKKHGGQLTFGWGTDTDDLIEGLDRGA